MFPSVCRRRRLLLAISQISAGGDGGARNRIHPSPSTVLLSHLCSSTAAAPKFEPCPRTTAYLVSCGVSPATAAIRKVRIRDTDNADAVCALLREYGFSDAELTRAVGADPQLLTLAPDKTLRPKLEFLLISLGLRPRVIAAEPHILSRSLEKHLVPSVAYLRGIIGTDDNLIRAISNNPRAFMADVDKTMRPAVEALRRHGLSKASVAKLLTINMGVLNVSIDRIAEAFEDLKKLGMRVRGSNFVYAFRAICCLKRETWQRKVALFGSFGVTHDVLIRAFMRQPTILLVSEETLKKKVRFFLDELKLELNSVMQQPMLLCLSLEKCVKPRCAVLSLLMREGKLECRKPNLISALLCNARVFRKRFVLKHADELPIIAKAFEGGVEFKGFGERETELFSS